MINSEKYLKDKKELKDFLSDYIEYCKRNKQDSVNFESLSLFLMADVKAKLSEDERVILRNLNLDEFTHIGRHYLGDLFLKYKTGTILNEYNFECYRCLFQFIKERRRI